jgi:hypothetical protein
MVAPPEIRAPVLVHYHADGPTRKSPPICLSVGLSFAGQVNRRGSSALHLSYVGRVVNRESGIFHCQRQ